MTIRMWPDAAPDYFWPSNITQQETIEAFTEFYATHGYEMCDDKTLEVGFEKIALYLEDNEVTHAARQLQSGYWSSKLGIALEDIEHDTLEALERPGYGQSRVFMRRPYVS